MVQGVADRDEKLKALKYHQLEADITRLKGNLASVPVPIRRQHKECHRADAARLEGARAEIVVFK